MLPEGMEKLSVMRWLLTTRSGFWGLGLQMIATAAAQACLHSTGDPHPVFLAVPALLLPGAVWTLRANWLLRHRHCACCGGRAARCWPECKGKGRTLKHNPDGGTQ